LAYQVNIDEECEGFCIQLHNGSKVYLSSIFWDNVTDGYLKKSSLPKVCYIENDFTPEKNIPLLYGDGLLEVDTSSIRCGIDVFAACFFMLSRMEEAIITVRDDVSRFPATASTAYKNNFLDRPVVDEYVDMLWNMLIYLDPSLSRYKLKPKTFVTCDLDWPFDPIRRSFKLTFLKSAADLIKRKKFMQSMSTWKKFLIHILGIPQLDTYRRAIDWIMEVNEEAGNNVAFYFITHSTSRKDTSFDFNSSEMHSLLRSINDRGHEIGLHPGYNCFDNDSNFKVSVEKLRKAIRDVEIFQPEIGGRMHYLRWDVMQTPQLWEKYNLNYDSTLSFADKSGFRCGTSHEFTMFNLVTRKAMKLKQRPLVNMECTVIASRYEGLGYSDEAIERFKHFKKQTKKYGGTYTLLWHNSHFSNEQDKSFYRQLIN